MGEVKVFLVRGRAGVARLGGLSARMEEVRAVGCEVVSWDWDVWPLTGDLKGVLKGERKGFARVWEAASMRRRLAAGVDILTLIGILVAMLRQR